jgi:AraC-like DNA-binding protein
MSPSTFRQHFRGLAGVSPLQYQKRLRLQEARQLMLNESLDAGSAGGRVGYEARRNSAASTVVARRAASARCRAHAVGSRCHRLTSSHRLEVRSARRRSTLSLAATVARISVNWGGCSDLRELAMKASRLDDFIGPAAHDVGAQVPESL